MHDFKMRDSKHRHIIVGFCIRETPIRVTYEARNVNVSRMCYEIGKRPSHDHGLSRRYLALSLLQVASHFHRSSMEDDFRIDVKSHMAESPLDWYKQVRAKYNWSKASQLPV